LTPRCMWLIALVLSVGALSLATAALPGRARPLFLLPVAFGVAAAGFSILLRRSLGLACSTPVWLVTTALALGGYGQVVASSFQQFEAQSAASGATDPNAIIAIEMLKGTEQNALAEEMEKDLANRPSRWDSYLSHRYAAVGGLSRQSARFALAIEALLVIAGVAVGRRFLDSTRGTCQAADPVASTGDGFRPS
jgi:hypothetical protein